MQAFPTMLFVMIEIISVVTLSIIFAKRHHGEWVMLSTILVPVAMMIAAIAYSLNTPQQNDTFRGDLTVYVIINMALAFVIGYFLYVGYRLSEYRLRARH